MAKEKTEQEKAKIGRAGEASRAEAAEWQLRALKDEVDGLKRSHDVEMAAAKEAMAEQVTAYHRSLPLVTGSQY